MVKETPINLEEFFMSRNEIASKHNSKLELQAMARVREHLVEEQQKQAEAKEKAKVVAEKPKAKGIVKK